MAEREYTVVAPDGKEVTLIGPVGASNDEVIAQAKKLYSSTPQNQGTPIYGDLPSAVGGKPNIVGYQKQPEVQPTTMADRVKALYEVPRTIIQGAAAPFIGAGAGLVQNIREGTNKPLDRPELAQRFQFEPTSPVSQDVLGSMNEALTASKLPAFIPTVGTAARATQQASRSSAPMVTGNLPSYDQLANTVKPAVNRLADALKEPKTSTMSGVGAALVPEAVDRAKMAEQLRVPIKLSKGEATRDLAQQQFEAETMKTYSDTVGKPLIIGKELRNQQIGQNLDAYVDATGAKVANEFYLRPTGEAVDTALRETANASKKAYKNAYDVARASEEGQQKVNVQGVISQLDNMEAEAVNAPVINSAKIKLNQLAKDGEMTLNEIEEVRKMVNRLSGDTPSNMAFGGDIKTMIDTATKDAGGDLFKEARKLRTKFANEFENIGLIDDLLSKKPNSKDRVIAMEKVFDKSVMQSDLDSLKSLGYTLKKTEKGQQAFAELKGQTIENLRNSITKNTQTDSLGQRNFSPKQFDLIVKNLDKSGKLDYLFGKAGAQEIRNLRNTVININSPVSGINQSNTSSALDKVFNKLLQKIPFVGPMVEVGAEAAENQKIKARVDEALNFDPNNLAKELRKGK